LVKVFSSLFSARFLIRLRASARIRLAAERVFGINLKYITIDLPMSISKAMPLSLRSIPWMRSVGVVGFSTALSRILGFVRDWLIAFLYGTSEVAQAFVVAFRIPNLLRDMVAEGASNAAFVPVLSRTLAREGKESWRQLAKALWGRVVVFFVIVCGIGVWASRDLVRWVAPGLMSDPYTFGLAVDLTRILFPFIGLVGIWAFFMGVLNSVHRFALPALGPALLNLSMIVGMLLWRAEARGLAWGVMMGGVLQWILQVPALKKEGIPLTWGWQRHPAVREVGRMLIPRAVGSAVYQASVLVDTIFASFGHWVGAGGIAALYFAHRFLHLPLALFGVSMAQVTLPTVASQVAMRDGSGLRETVWTALKASWFVAVPSSVGLVVLAHPIIQTLLQHGRFSTHSVALTVGALQGYALGLCALCAGKIFANTLYAFGDTWTPVRSSAIALGLNIVLNLLLIRPLGLMGLALATSLSAIWNAFHLYRALFDRIGSPPLPWRRDLLKTLFASLAMGGLVFWFVRFGSGLGWLLLTVALGVASFLVCVNWPWTRHLPNS
jgi:putative peptidoglycan lipid II flippase